MSLIKNIECTVLCVDLSQALDWMDLENGTLGAFMDRGLHKYCGLSNEHNLQISPYQKAISWWESYMSFMLNEYFGLKTIVIPKCDQN